MNDTSVRHSHKAGIIKRSGETLEVKNLGWLLRRTYKHHNISSIDVIDMNPTERYISNMECWLYVYFEDGYIFHTTYASKVVLKWFLSRPSFKHIQINWNAPSILGRS